MTGSHAYKKREEERAVGDLVQAVDCRARRRRRTGVRRVVDPAAGDWFPEMALELVHNAVPPLP